MCDLIIRSRQLVWEKPGSAFCLPAHRDRALASTNRKQSVGFGKLRQTARLPIIPTRQQPHFYCPTAKGESGRYTAVPAERISLKPPIARIKLINSPLPGKPWACVSNSMQPQGPRKNDWLFQEAIKGGNKVDVT
jgi:hypothetical protein